MVGASLKKSDLPGSETNLPEKSSKFRDEYKIRRRKDMKIEGCRVIGGKHRSDQGLPVNIFGRNTMESRPVAKRLELAHARVGGKRSKQKFLAT